MPLKLSKGKKCPWETKEFGLPVSLLSADKTCSAEETGLVSLHFVGTCGWSQHSFSREGTLLGEGCWE